MWKVAVVQPMTEGFGFNITTETNVQLVSFAYAARASNEGGTSKPAAETAGTAETGPYVGLAIIPDRFLQFLRFLHCGLGLVGGGVDGRINDPPQYRPAALPATWFPQAAQPPSGG
jgi:hypothetical protein